MTHLVIMCFKYAKCRPCATFERLKEVRVLSDTISPSSLSTYQHIRAQDIAQAYRYSLLSRSPL